MNHTLLPILFLLALTGQSVAAQAKWSTYSPPDKSFSIEFPEASSIKREKISYEEENISYIFGKAKSADVYSLVRENEAEPSFWVYVFYPAPPLKNKRFDREVNSNMLWLFGDDKRFSKKSDTIMNGLHGREFVFEKGDMSGRAVFANAGRRIFLLLYTKGAGVEVTAEMANRIFKTFKPFR